MFSFTSRNAMAHTYRLRQTCPSGTRIASVRHLHRATPLSYPRKDDQDKDSINTESTEYSKSGSDAAAAGVEEAAFDPKKTSPEDEKKTADKESGDDPNPLDVSPANADVSKPRGSTEGGAQDSGAGREKSSGGGSPTKNRPN